MNIRKLIWAFIALISIVSFASCSKDDDDASRPGKNVSLVGHWKAKDANSQSIMSALVFEKDGTGYYTTHKEGAKQPAKVTFTYHQEKGDVLVIDETNGRHMKASFTLTGKQLRIFYHTRENPKSKYLYFTRVS